MNSPLSIDYNTTDLKQGFRIGEWQVSPLSGTFSRLGHSVHVEPKVMDVLLCLAGGNGDVVTREELFNCAWVNVVVTDEVLTRCISELRTLLGDTTRERRYVRTIPKRGYQLLVPVELTPSMPGSIEADRGIYDSGIVEKSIAVLPFVDMSQGQDNEYFSDGLADELTNALTQIPALRVAARTSTFSFKGKNTDIKIIGEKLKVRHVLEGSVHIIDDKLRVTAQLVNVNDGFQLWSESFSRDLCDIFKIQEEIAHAVSLKLVQKLDAVDHKPFVRACTSNHEAYKWYLQGRQKYQTEQSGFLYSGTQELEKAINFDPEFADAHGLLAYVNVLRTVVDPYGTVASSIRSSYEKALQNNPDQPEALMSKAIDIRWQNWDWREVHSMFEKAMLSAPNDPHVLTQYASRYFRDLGNQQKARQLLWRAIDIDPLNTGPRSALAFVYRYELNFKASIEQAEIAIRLSPQYGFANLCLILTLISDGQFARPEKRLIAVEKFIGKEHPLSLQARGRLYASMGKSTETGKVLDILFNLYEKTSQEVYQPALAQIFIAMGELEDGISWYEKALQNKISSVIVSRAGAPLMDINKPNLLSEPLFQNFLSKMNLDNESVQVLEDEGLL